MRLWFPASRDACHHKLAKQPMPHVLTPPPLPSRFSLSFGEDAGYPGFIGNPATYGLFKNVGAAPVADFAASIPLVLFSLFQLMFAVITPALIIGAIAER